ncbi:hypothetical protein [Pseudomonas sp. NPDC089758]|uniref:hypothetical protein n=1 Tax=Pseudomonas sp. NPDC089758 TaxID=3364473 RepID=UPI00380CA1D7
MNTPAVLGYYETLLNAPTFSNDSAGQNQARRWKLLVDDVHNSASESDLRQARNKIEGYILGLMDAGSLNQDGERDYKILGSIHRRQEFLRKLLSTM